MASVTLETQKNTTSSSLHGESAWQYNGGTGTNRCLVFIYSYLTNTDATSGTVYVNFGVDNTAIADRLLSSRSTGLQGTGRCLTTEIWYYINPPIGLATLKVTFSGTVVMADSATILVYDNVHQISTGAGGSTTSASVQNTGYKTPGSSTNYGYYGGMEYWGYSFGLASGTIIGLQTKSNVSFGSFGSATTYVQITTNNWESKVESSFQAVGSTCANYYNGSAYDSWGRTWAISDLSNLKLRISDGSYAWNVCSATTINIYYYRNYVEGSLTTTADSAKIVGGAAVYHKSATPFSARNSENELYDGTTGSTLGDDISYWVFDKTAATAGAYTLGANFTDAAEATMAYIALREAPAYTTSTSSSTSSSSSSSSSTSTSVSGTTTSKSTSSSSTSTTKSTSTSSTSKSYSTSTTNTSVSTSSSSSSSSSSSTSSSSSSVSTSSSSVSSSSSSMSSSSVSSSSSSISSTTIAWKPSIKDINPQVKHVAVFR